MGTNFLGPFLLTMLLLPCMQRTAKVVRACRAHVPFLCCLHLPFKMSLCRQLLHDRLVGERCKHCVLTYKICSVSEWHIDPTVVVQSNHGHPIRVVNVSSKMHELSPGIDVRDPHFAKGRAYSSLAAYNRSKLAQVALSLASPKLLSLIYLLLVGTAVYEGPADGLCGPPWRAWRGVKVSPEAGGLQSQL